MDNGRWRWSEESVGFGECAVKVCCVTLGLVCECDERCGLGERGRGLGFAWSMARGMDGIRKMEKAGIGINGRWECNTHNGTMGSERGMRHEREMTEEDTDHHLVISFHDMVGNGTAVQEATA